LRIRLSSAFYPFPFPERGEIPSGPEGALSAAILFRFPPLSLFSYRFRPLPRRESFKSLGRPGFSRSRSVLRPGRGAQTSSFSPLTALTERISHGRCSSFRLLALDASLSPLCQPRRGTNAVIGRTPPAFILSPD